MSVDELADKIEEVMAQEDVDLSSPVATDVPVETYNQLLEKDDSHMASKLDWREGDVFIVQLNLGPHEAAGITFSYLVYDTGMDDYTNSQGETIFESQNPGGASKAPDQCWFLLDNHPAGGGPRGPPPGLIVEVGYSQATEGPTGMYSKLYWWFANTRVNEVVLIYIKYQRINGDPGPEDRQVLWAEVHRRSHSTTGQYVEHVDFGAGYCPNASDKDCVLRLSLKSIFHGRLPKALIERHKGDFINIHLYKLQQKIWDAELKG